LGELGVDCVDVVLNVFLNFDQRLVRQVHRLFEKVDVAEQLKALLREGVEVAHRGLGVHFKLVQLIRLHPKVKV
jgi:hypothetical protein